MALNRWVSVRAKSLPLLCGYAPPKPERRPMRPNGLLSGFEINAVFLEDVR